MADKHSELEKQNQTLLNAIDDSPSTQLAIKSLLTTTEAIKSNNLQLTKSVDTLTIALNTKIKEIESLKSKLAQKQSELDITKQEKNDYQPTISYKDLFHRKSFYRKSFQRKYFNFLKFAFHRKIIFNIYSNLNFLLIFLIKNIKNLIILYYVSIFKQYKNGRIR